MSSQLARTLAAKQAISIPEATEMLHKVFDAIRSELDAGKLSRVPQFGIFEKVHKPERVGKLFGSDEQFTFPARDVVTFRATRPH